MEKRKLTLQELENRDFAEKICSELRQIAGMKAIELCFETREMVFETDPAFMPRVEHAVVTIIHILDHRIHIIGEDGNEI